MHKDALLLLKNCKSRPALGLSPQTPLHPNGLRRLRPRLPLPQLRILATLLFENRNDVSVLIVYVLSIILFSLYL